MTAPATTLSAAGTDGRRGLIALALLGTALRLGLVWSGACDNRVVADDAFYYFAIARNVAAGLGPTFDGLAATNGFHPLWLLLLTPVFALAHALLGRRQAIEAGIEGQVLGRGQLQGLADGRFAHDLEEVLVGGDRLPIAARRDLALGRGTKRFWCLIWNLLERGGLARLLHLVVRSGMAPCCTGPRDRPRMIQQSLPPGRVGGPSCLPHPGCAFGLRRV
mgnify:CR=1 FL=1